MKITVQGETVHEVAEGDGPVNALDAALRKALVRFYPQLETMHRSRRLQGPHHRRRARYRGQDARLHRVERWRHQLGDGRRFQGHHRGLLDRLARQCGVRAHAARNVAVQANPIHHRGAVENGRESNDPRAKNFRVCSNEGQFRRPDLGSLHNALLLSLTRGRSPPTTNLSRLLAQLRKSRNPTPRRWKECLATIVSGKLTFSNDDFNRWAKDLEPQKFNLSSLSDALSRSITKVAFSSDDFERLLKKSDADKAS